MLRIHLAMLGFMLTGILSFTFTVEKHAEVDLSKEWYLSASDNWWTGPRLFVKEVGHGPDTVLMIHGGWGAEHSYLIDAVAGLTSEFTFIFYDQRGSLRSPCPDSLITLNHHVEDIERLRKELGLDQCRIFAHSMGTILASHYLDRYPARVSNLTMAGLVFPVRPFPDSDTIRLQKVRADFQQFVQRPQMIAEMEKNGVAQEQINLDSKARTIQWRHYFAAGNLYYVDRWRQLKGGMAYYNQKAANATIESYRDRSWDLLDTYRRSGVPITVINGSHDIPDCNADIIGDWLDGIDKAEFYVLEKAGHNSWIDRPEQFKKFLRKGLRKS